MLVNALESKAIKALRRYGASPRFAWVAGGFAFAASLSVFVPFGGLLAACVLLAPSRWRAIVWCTSLGAALGGSLLSLTFKQFGVGPLVQAYPELMQSSSWIDARDWLNHYGIISLVAIAALPVPLTPALLVACLANLPIVQIAPALWLGRWIKFYVYAWGSVSLSQQWKKAQP